MFSLHSRRNMKRRKEREICRARAHAAMITEKAMSCAMYTEYQIYFLPVTLTMLRNPPSLFYRRDCPRQRDNKIIRYFDVLIVRTTDD